MQLVALSEIKNISEYEKERETFRPYVMAVKEKRRIRLGDHLTFLFENRDTVRYQIQEMMRVEKITREQDIAHEVETYNELIPAPGELSASLLIEYETAAERNVKLRELLGLEQHLWLEVSGAGASQAVFDERQIATDRISSVQYVKFRLSHKQQDHWHLGASLFCDHRHYLAMHKFTETELNELAGDFK